MMHRWLVILRRLAAPIAGVAIFLLIAVHAWSPVHAQVSLDSRLSRLETDLAGLRNQVNQLAAARSLSSGTAPSTAPPVYRQPTSADSRFDRLATLVIELKERVTKLEEQRRR
ncbi:MAG: hypothetical protein KME13_01925 [Myxacorys californica WJT36-NPBG1]|nr:hypothetical protein [Myxacorys californica WJT36-NPBG1]